LTRARACSKTLLVAATLGALAALGAALLACVSRH
jgi:hypothetical protein